MMPPPASEKAAEVLSGAAMTNRHRAHFPQQEGVADHEPGGLGRILGRSLGWSFLNNVASRLFSVLSGIVLARLLVPEDYGVFAIALIVLNAGLSMNELGVSLAVVRWGEDELDKIAPTVATMALGWSAALYAVCWLMAPVVGTTLHAADAAILIRVLSVCILVDSVAAVPAALITRKFLQGRRLTIDLVSAVCGTGLSIGLAVGGLGAWAMVWGFVTSNVVAGILTTWLSPGRLRLGWSVRAARSLLSFGLPLAGSSFLVFIMLNVDYVIVARLLGSEALGFYLLAFNVCSWPVILVSAAVRRVSFAAFSRLAGDTEVAGRAFCRSAGLLMAMTFPLCALVAMYAEPGVAFLYGQKWMPAVETMRWLCVLGAARVALELAYDYLAAMRRTIADLILQMLWIVLLIPALIVGAQLDGIRGVAVAHAVVAGAVVLPAFIAVLARCHVDVVQLVRLSLRPVLSVAAIALSSWVVLAVLERTLLQLLVGGVVGLGLSAVLLAPMRALAGSESAVARR